ncbi:MAG: PfkB family carbohydrate kinase [Planctomycetota bacterium]|jgi:sugar/nucleoside kinase (ribokinase family)|nr:PfkB family carbohydrate kinase [Planctomycetota bacterium]
MPQPVLTVGSIALDTIRMPDGKIYKDVPGGSCTYFIHSAHFFVPVRVVGVVGEDFPKKYLDGFKKCRADLAGLRILPGQTFQWHGSYQSDMNSRVTDALLFGVFETFNPVLPEKYLDSKYIFLACAQPELQSRVLDQVRDPALAVCDTIEIYIREQRRALDKLIRRCQGMIVNDAEARLLSGDANLVKAAAGIVKKYKLSFLVLKKGEHGGLLAGKDGIIPFPAYPLVRVADPTGAGDCFAGGFMGSLARSNKTDGKTLRLACANATAVASAACEGVALYGLLRATPAAIRKRADDFLKMTRLG